MAAQGYQESQLDQTRRSAVGAIGEVMPATGEKLDVGNIAQLEPNIHAGVKYIRTLVDQYFAGPELDPVNRLLFAFAAYNAGPARVRALRDEARRRGLNPDVWFDNVERIAAERVGRETVQYVANIYKYYVAYTLVEADGSAASSSDGAARPATGGCGVGLRPHARGSLVSSSAQATPREN